jgi:cyanophycinase
MSREAGAGPLFAIGGAEDKLDRCKVLGRFVQAAGGDEARIVVVPTASSLGPEIVDVYDVLLRRLGVADVVGVRPESRDEADDEAFSAPLRRATGVFLTGGNQLKLSAIVAGTRFGDEVRAAHARGATVGGTSAGASVLAEHMVAFGAPGATPKQRMSQLAVGLGLVQAAVIDQHFTQRNRFGRLLSIVAQSPSLLGIGIDEDTAAIFADGHLEVAGRGAVTIVDGGRVLTDAFRARRHEPLLVSGAVLHSLPDGACFDLSERQLVGIAPRPADPEVVEARAAEAEIELLAHDVASVGPTTPAARRRGEPRRPERRAQ